MNEPRSAFDEFKYTVTPEDVPMLKESLEFEVHLSSENGTRSFVPPIDITFFCEDITYEESVKSGGYGHVPAHIPCHFSAVIPETDVKMEPGSMSINFGPAIIRTVNDFFNGMMLCKSQDDAEKMFNQRIHIEKVKSLTDVYERKTITEKHHKRNTKKTKR